MAGLPRLRALVSMAAVLAVVLGVAACGSSEGDERVETTPDDTDIFKDRSNRKTIFGEGGILFFGDDKQEGNIDIGVNSFLWRASLDTISFMPVTSADPFGGVIITDWYTPPQAPNERFKVNVYILGRALRADGIRAAVFRQQQAAAGWVDAPVAPNTATDIENAILTRARQLRIAQLGE